MNKKAKIVVLHLKELVYTGIFLLLGILFVVILVMMFSVKEEPEAAALYTPGKYTTSLELGGNTVDVVVVVDSDSIASISLEHLEESVSAMYPLIEPALEELSAQILKQQSVDNVTYSDDNQYTSMVLLNAISNSLTQAKTAPEDSGAE